MNKVKYYRDEEFPYFEIKSCSTTLHSSKEHAHEELSIAIIEKGKTTLQCENKSIDIRENDAVFIGDKVIHKCDPGDINDWQFKMLYIDKEWFNNLIDNDFSNKNGLNNNYSCDVKLTIKKLNCEDRKVIDESFSCLTSSNTDKETVLIKLIDFLFGIENYFTFKSDNEKNIVACHKVKAIIEDKFKEKITLDYLSKESGISKYYIIKLFNELFNTTPHAYQILLRMNYAKKELANGKTIIDISNEVGYYDQSHFTKTFKEYFGVTPSSYKL